MGDKEQVKFQSTPVPGGCLVQISGHINEFFNRQDLISAISGSTVVFDLDNVKRITSFGVKQWLQAFRDFWVEYYAFINCRPAIMSQFNMVNHFGGVGQIINFYAPYFCQNCDREADVLIDLRSQYEEIKRGEPPQARCPSCQELMEFDDSPESYFSYVSSCPPPVVPKLAAQLIDGESLDNIQPESSKEKGHFRVKKDIAERVTGLWMSGPLQSKNQLRRLLDALEGSVVIMTSEITEVSQEGMGAFRTFLEAPDIQFYLARVPEVLWETLRATDPHQENIRLVSLWLRKPCPRCKETIELEADQKLLKEAKGGLLPTTCPHCQASVRLSLAVPAALQARLVSSLPPAVTHYLQKRAGQSPDSSPGHTAWPSIYEKPSGAIPGQVMRRCPRCQSFYPADVAACPNDGEKTVPLVHDSRKESFVGKFIGSYQITQKLGEGGMGSVYAAQHPALGKKIAVKFLRPKHAQQESLVERLFAEAKAASQVGNEHIIDVQDFGKLDDRFPYIVMEFLEGEPLQDLLKREKKLQPRDALSLFFQLLDALMAAHEKGIIHRDLKPDNIFLIGRGQQEHFVKLLDFGIAKLVDSNTPMTMMGMIMGTPHYMPPEQAEGKISEIDARSDLYAAGVILFQMLCGRLPFVASNATELMVAHITTPPPSPRSINPSLSAALDAAILKALAKDPRDRFQSAEEMLHALQAVPEADGIQFKPTSKKIPVVTAQPASPSEEMRTILEELPPDPVLEDLNTIAVSRPIEAPLPQPTTRPIRPLKLKQGAIKVTTKSQPAVPVSAPPKDLPLPPPPPVKEVKREVSPPPRKPTPPASPRKPTPPTVSPPISTAPPVVTSPPPVTAKPPVVSQPSPVVARPPVTQPPVTSQPPAASQPPVVAKPPVTQPPVAPSVPKPQISVIPPMLEENQRPQEKPQPQQPASPKPYLASALEDSPDGRLLNLPSIPAIEGVPGQPTQNKLFWIVLPVLFALLGGGVTTILFLLGII